MNRVFNYVLFVLILLFCTSSYATIKGNIDGVNPRSDGYYIHGWACDTGKNQSIKIHLYAGGPAGQGSIIKGANANLANETAVNHACGTSSAAHRFRVKLTGDDIRRFKNKPIYIHGISVSKQPNDTIHRSGYFRMPNPRIAGHIDGLSQRGDGYYIHGWACDSSMFNAIDIHLYAGGPAGRGRIIKGARANLPSETAVSKACGTRHIAHRFSVKLTGQEILKFANEPIYIHGISKSRGGNYTIHNSGKFSMPNQGLLSDITPNAHGDLVIPANTVVTINTNISTRFLKVNGRLECPRTGHFKVAAEGILVKGRGAQLLCGSNADPFLGTLDITLKGNRNLLGDKTARSLMVMDHGVINMHSNSDRMAARTKLLGTRLPGATDIRLAKAMDWRVGEEIVVATTSFNMYENERRIIRAVSRDKRTFTLDKPLDYRHHGEIERYANDVRSWILNQRAQVINLERNITISAPNDSLFVNDKLGGHVMIMGSGKAYLRGVAFERMGQMGILGRYPFHWHFVGNGRGQYVKNSLVLESVQRCFTIHATNYTTLDNNACYDHFSHGYFLEDGNEMHNRITNNIGILSKRPPAEKALLISDFSRPGFHRRAGAPSTFWISHPTNTVHSNVSVASEGSGFWMSFVQKVDCTHSGCQSDKVYPKSSPTTNFSNNWASTNQVGFTWDGAQDPDGNPEGNWTGNKNNPKDFKLRSSHYEVRSTFKNLVAFKSKEAGIYYRGNTAIFDNARLADNDWSAFMAYNQSLTNTLVVAKSANHDPNDCTNPLNNSAVKGIVMYDGPFDLNNTHFQNFSSVPEYGCRNSSRNITSTPISLIGGAGKYTNISRKVSFAPEPLYKIDMTKGVGRGNLSDTYVTSLRDLGKHFDYYPPGDHATLFRPNVPFNDDPSCKIAEGSLNTIRCNYKMAVLRFGHSRGHGIAKSDFIVTRYNKKLSTWDASHQRLEGDAVKTKFSVIVNGNYEYYVRNIDAKDPNGFSLIYESETTGEVSPLIKLSHFHGNCHMTNMQVSELREFAKKADLSRHNGAGYVRSHFDGAFWVKFKSTIPRHNAPTVGVHGGHSNRIRFVCP